MFVGFQFGGRIVVIEIVVIVVEIRGSLSHRVCFPPSLCRAVKRPKERAFG
jgi:hypothetical protein